MEDLIDVHRLFDIELNTDDLHTEKMDTMKDRSKWLEWSVLNYAQLARLYQPPYGDRAIMYLDLTRAIATTDFDNNASMGVMRKLGMRIEKKTTRGASLVTSGRGSGKQNMTITNMLWAEGRAMTMDSFVSLTSGTRALLSLLAFGKPCSLQVL